MITIPKNVTEDFHFVFNVYDLLGTSDDFKIRNEELSNVDVSTSLTKFPLKRGMVVKMLRNQNKLSEMLPAHHDFIYTFFSSAILGDRCMKLKFCNPDNVVI